MKTHLGFVVMAWLASTSFAQSEPSAAQGSSSDPTVATNQAVAPTQSVRQPRAKSGPKPLEPMQIVMVKSSEPGCEPNCPEWIAAQGMIDAETLPKFKKLFRVLGSRKLPILIDSGGGVVDDSLTIGRLIRAKGLDVIVSKTTFQPCRDVDPGCKSGIVNGVARGVSNARLSKCASSCAFILAAGERRIVSATAFVGVHQLKTLRTTAQVLQKFRIERQLVWGVPTEVRRTLISEKLVNKKTLEAKTPESAYVKVAKYFRDMGVAETIMPMLKGTPNTAIHWLSRTELKSTGMATDVKITAESAALPNLDARIAPQAADGNTATSTGDASTPKIVPLPAR
jgi:hypothetical protein